MKKNTETILISFGLVIPLCKIDKEKVDYINKSIQDYMEFLVEKYKTEKKHISKQTMHKVRK